MPRICTHTSQDFFGKPAYLTVSGQLNGEYFACAFGSIYTFGPTFRAENSNTTRHLAEFWMIEPEIAFCELPQNMDCAEGYLRHCFRHVLSECAEDLAFLEEAEEKRKQEAGEATDGEAKLRERLQVVADNDFARITYTEAIEIVQKVLLVRVRVRVRVRRSRSCRRWPSPSPSPEP